MRGLLEQQGVLTTDTLVQGIVGCHDFLLTPCGEATFRHFYPEHPVHRGCFGNLAEALWPFGVEPDAIPTAFNLFMNVPVDARTGKLDETGVEQALVNLRRFAELARAMGVPVHVAARAALDLGVNLHAAAELLARAKVLRCGVF